MTPGEMNVPELKKTISGVREEVEMHQEEATKAVEASDSLEDQLKKKKELATSTEKTIAELEGEVEELERKNWSLSAELASKTDELNRIVNSPGWKLFAAYGRIKYRYLLPVYRLLGLPPYGRVANKLNQTGLVEGEPDVEILNPVAVSSRSAAMRQPRIPAKSNAFDVVCFPIIDWDFRFQRPQQLMVRLAAAGHRIFYVSNRFRSSGPLCTVQPKANNIWEVSLRGPALNVYRQAMDPSGRHEFFIALNALRRELGLGATAAIVQLPFWWPLASEARAQLGWPVVYDCMDDHAGFSTNGTQMLEQEEELMTSADLITTSSTVLEQRARLHNDEVVLVRNGCDYEHFAREKERNSGRPVVGYYGAIAEWFDSDLVADIAEKRADWDFVLVGATLGANTRRLDRLPNVRFLGERPYSQIPEFLGGFDVAILPFKRTQLTEATNPVKAYEIMASGKPLVSVPIPEMAALSSLVRLAATEKEFEEQIEAALGETGMEFVQQRREFARQHTWDVRAEQLAPLLSDAFSKVSIIVVTYNNLALNRLCLESIYARTEWPNFEVMVVDNASTDGTPDYLKQAEASFPNLRVILNDRNLGFAAANNLGLKEATGDYLILLNNDTVVTRSWASSLIRHLHANAQIGLIGPVTNSIGNEARIDVGYTSLDELPGWAADYLRKHDGEVFSIPMLAMFCVAMRRDVYEQIGPLDEQFGIGMFEDDDYSMRIKANGLRVACAADSFVHHFGKASFKTLMETGEYQRLFDENRRLYESKWKIEWTPHKYLPSSAQRPALVRDKSLRQVNSRAKSNTALDSLTQDARFAHMKSIHGRCNVCGKDTLFFFLHESLYRESLNCGSCLTTSRYRSIARGILLAIKELRGLQAPSLAELDPQAITQPVAVYDTQIPYRYATSAYPLPDILSNCKWIELRKSGYRPEEPWGVKLGKGVTNQTLEALTFADDSFDIVLTSDVMEHVRLDDRAHHEIQRVLRPGGFYVFTVPHFRHQRDTFYHVAVSDPEDPSQDRYLTEKVYHGDAYSADGQSLSYRAYGTELDDALKALGFDVNYSKQDLPELGILNTELFLCRLAK